AGLRLFSGNRLAGGGTQMRFSTIEYSLDGGVATLVFNRPDKLNSFTVQMHEEVAEALDCAVQGGARVLLLTGNGRGFCTGQDLSDIDLASFDPGASLERHYNPTNPGRDRKSTRLNSSHDQ